MTGCWRRDTLPLVRTNGSERAVPIHDEGSLSLFWSCLCTGELRLLVQRADSENDQQSGHATFACLLRQGNDRHVTALHMIAYALPAPPIYGNNRHVVVLHVIAHVLPAPSIYARVGFLKFNILACPPGPQRDRGCRGSGRTARSGGFR